MILSDKSISEIKNEFENFVSSTYPSDFNAIFDNDFYKNFAIKNMEVNPIFNVLLDVKRKNRINNPISSHIGGKYEPLLKMINKFYARVDYNNIEIFDHLAPYFRTIKIR